MGGWGVEISLPHSLDKRTERLHLVGEYFLSYSIHEIFERFTYVPILLSNFSLHSVEYAAGSHSNHGSMNEGTS